MCVLDASGETLLTTSDDDSISESNENDVKGSYLINYVPFRLLQCIFSRIITLHSFFIEYYILL